MQTTANSGKYLSEKWHRDRERALVDPSQFTTEELEWLEITAEDPVVSPHNPEEFDIDTVPIDPLTDQQTKYDIRKRPETGDKGLN